MDALVHGCGYREMEENHAKALNCKSMILSKLITQDPRKKINWQCKWLHGRALRLLYSACSEALSPRFEHLALSCQSQVDHGSA